MNQPNRSATDEGFRVGLALLYLTELQSKSVQQLVKDGTSGTRTRFPRETTGELTHGQWFLCSFLSKPASAQRLPRSTIHNDDVKVRHTPTSTHIDAQIHIQHC